MSDEKQPDAIEGVEIIAAPMLSKARSPRVERSAEIFRMACSVAAEGRAAIIRCRDGRERERMRNALRNIATNESRTLHTESRSNFTLLVWVDPL